MVEPGSNPQVTAVIVLAAGAGTRMKSSIPKVLHPIAGKPLLWHALAATSAVEPDQVVAVLGHGRDEVRAFLESATGLPAVRTAVQDLQLGTGHAVECGLTVTGALTGTVLVTYGDVPLLTGATLTALTSEHTVSGNAVTVLTADVPDPHGYGRIVRDDDGHLTAIVEQKDADDAQRAISEINSGIYAFDGAVLSSVLPRLGSANAQGERYLTDAVAIVRGDGLPVGTVSTTDPVEIEGVNDRVQLAELSRVLRDRLVRKAQLAGVTVMDPATTWIHADVTVGPDTVLYPDTSLEAGTTIGSGCRIGPATTLSACTVDDGAVVLRSHCEGAHIGSGASVGPFTFLRPDADLAAGAKVGAYVEVKKSTIGPKAKVPHLSYIGDATIGAGTNMGAGSITANYDGVRKSDTVIGENAFIGTNSTLVAPVTIADGAYVAAGSTVTDGVAAGELAVARGRQHNSAGWVLRRRAGSASDASARAAGAAEQRPLPGSSPRSGSSDAEDATP